MRFYMWICLPLFLTSCHSMSERQISSEGVDLCKMVDFSYSVNKPDGNVVLTGETVPFPELAPGVAFSRHIVIDAEELINTDNKVSELQVGPIEMPFEFRSGSFPGAGGTCSTVLPNTYGEQGSESRNSCFLDIEFKPVLAGASDSDLNISFTIDKLECTKTLSLTGSAIDANI